MKYWLMKTEPSTYSIDDLMRDRITPWEGVRNYQARNIMRDDMKVDDLVLFYHSNAKPPGVVGVAKVSREGYPDHFAWDSESRYFDPKASPDHPIWQMVEVAFVRRFHEMVSLDRLKACEALAGMMVCQRGARLSVQPVSKVHYETVLQLASDLEVG